MATTTSSPSPLPETNFAKAYLYMLHASTGGQQPGFSNTYVAAQAQTVARGQHLCLLGKMPVAKKRSKRVAASSSSSSSSSGTKSGVSTSASSSGVGASASSFASSGTSGSASSFSSSPLSSGRTIKVTVKSIKAPKFVVSFEKVATSDSILDLKQQIFETQGRELFGGANADPAASIRLLIKGKVISDSKVLSDLAPVGVEELSFVAMVSVVLAKPSPSAGSNDEDPVVEVPEVASKPVVIDAALWSDIGKLLIIKLGSGAGSSALNKLKRGWEESK